jgi:hypothetical protein
MPARVLEEFAMLNQRENACLKESNECASACLLCASACLEQGDAPSMARCILLDRECADICHFAAVVIARGDEHLKAVCSICADACRNCSIECAKYPLDFCQKCAEACRRCAAAFRCLANGAC